MKKPENRTYRRNSDLLAEFKKAVELYKKDLKGDVAVIEFLKQIQKKTKYGAGKDLVNDFGERTEERVRDVEGAEEKVGKYLDGIGKEVEAEVLKEKPGVKPELLKQWNKVNKKLKELYEKK